MSANTAFLPPSPSPLPLPSSPLSPVRHLWTPLGSSEIRGKTTAGRLRRTTVRLENEFWRAIERLAADSGTTWRGWAEAELVAKPPQRGAASWLRTRCLDYFAKD